MTTRKVGTAKPKIGLALFDSLFHGSLNGEKMPESDYFFNEMIGYDGIYGNGPLYNYWSADSIPQCDDMLLLLNEVLSKEGIKHE